MNTLTDAEEAELAERIAARSWGWKQAFTAWYLVCGGIPDIQRHPDGTRTVTRDATQFIKANPHELARLGLADVVQADGTLRLDTAGEHRYEAVGEVDHGFTAYQKVTP